MARDDRTSPARIDKDDATADGRRRAKRDVTRDLHHCRVLKRKNLQGFSFLTIRRIRTKALMEARIEHAEFCRTRLTVLATEP